MKVLGDVCVPTGKYEQAGQEKTRWLKCGVLMQNDEGHYRLKLEAIPIGVADFEGWFSVFEKENRQPAARPQERTEPTAIAAGMNDDIPF